MRRCLTPALIVAAALSQPLTAFAQSNCPPGAWFCGDDDAAQAQPAPEEAEESDALPPPPPPADELDEDDDALPPPPPRVPHVRHAPPHARGRHAPPVVIYQPGPSASPPPQIIIVTPGLRARVVRRHAPVVRVTPAVRVVRTAPAAIAPTPMKRRWRSEWGLNLRLQGLSFGGDRDRDRDGDDGPSASKDAGMGGFGLALRYRPVLAFAFEAGVDIIGGTDFNGFERVEMPISLNGILYVNPRSRAQFYFTGGVHWSSATVTSDSPDPRLSPAPDGNGYSTEYKYFGGQGGIGFEFRMSRRFALNVDALAFIRKRTDDNVQQAEFVDPNMGNTTNTSAGGLVRGGLTFWW
jgi:hypothetical protein